MMTSAATRSLGDSGLSGSTFSYAQAAKGRVPSTTPSTVQSSQATSGTNTPSKEPAQPIDAISAIESHAEVSEADQNGTTLPETDLKIPSHGVESENRPMDLLPPVSSPSSPVIDSTSTPTIPKEDDSSLISKSSSDSAWEKIQSHEAVGERTSDINDRKKGKKAKKDKSADKDPEPEKEEIKLEFLVAAPPPTVNFWEQRKEALAAKVKTSPAALDSIQGSTDDAAANGAANHAGSKPSDIKKKAKLNPEESDRLANLGPAAKDQPSHAKNQKKSLDTTLRSREDSNGKRSAPRGSRMNGKDEKSVMDSLPPPVEDAVSWPTPDTALEEKRKPQDKVERDEKDEGGSNKPRPKEKWVTVPYIPTVTFNTPLPIRGRGGRGGGSSRGGSGRGGHGPNGSISGERTFSSTPGVNNASNEARERGRDNVSAGRATSLPPNSTKRTAGDSAHQSQDQQRKPSVASFEKARGDPSNLPAKSDNQQFRENRRTSMVAQTEPFSSGHQESVHQHADTLKSDKVDVSITNPDNQSQARSSGFDRRSESNIRMSDFPKESNGQSRDRGDGRPERGRGGYRGRGSHANFQAGQAHPQNAFTNGHPPQAQNAYGMRQSSGPYSPPPQSQQQQQYGTGYASTRGSRNGPPRSQSIPNNSTMYPRFAPNVPPISQQISPLQTVGPVFDYQGIQSMSAVPYNPFIEQYSVLAMVTMQLEYYFSIDNLCKDVFLRKHMDSKGFVFLTTIATFKRIQSLTQDFELLRFACQESEVIDIVIGEDGIDRLRRQDGWEKWVLAVEERDEIARNDGPERYYRQPIQPRPQALTSRVMTAPQSAILPAPFSPNGIESNFRPFASHSAGPNGVDHPPMYPTESPLSAAVPDFSPNPQHNLANDLDAETTFTDEEVEKLQLVYNHKGPADSRQKTPFHNASSRTFSNGSIDSRSIGDELVELHKRQGRTLTNGDSPSSDLPPDSLNRSRSPFALSPTKLIFGNAPPVMWVKGQKDQAPVMETNKNESYNVVRSRALRHRESLPLGEIDSDMKLLYQFWSHFLVRNFNPGMYKEFRNCAIDDAQHRQNAFGMNNLIQYYDEVLNSRKKTIPEPLARHYVEIVNSEDRSKERPGFTKLRAAWRNGALDMKSRKKVDNFVDPKLREELER